MSLAKKSCGKTKDKAEEDVVPELILPKQLPILPFGVNGKDNQIESQLANRLKLNENSNNCILSFASFAWKDAASNEMLDLPEEELILPREEQTDCVDETVDCG